MTKNGLTKYIYKIFKPRKVSTTILRKVYLTTKYPVIYNRKDMKDDACHGTFYRYSTRYLC